MLCMAGGVGGGKHLHLHTQGQGCRTTSLRAKQAWMSNLPFLESRAARGGIRGLFSCLPNALVTKLQTNQQLVKRTTNYKSRNVSPQNLQGRYPGRVMQSSSSGHPPPRQPQQDPNQKARHRLQILQNIVPHVDKERTDSFRIKPERKPCTKGAHGSLPDGCR